MFLPIQILIRSTEYTKSELTSKEQVIIQHFPHNALSQMFFS